MFDVVEAAAKRRQNLKAEIAKIDQFLAYADGLIKEAEGEAQPATTSAVPEMPSGEIRSDKASSAPVSPSGQQDTRPESSPGMNGRPSLFRGATSDAQDDVQKKIA